MVFERKMYATLLDSEKSKKISLIFGARQVGKTYLLKKLDDNLSSKKSKSRYFNLEFPDHSIEFNASESEIFEMLKKYNYIFIDEFHYVTNISKIFKAIYDWCDLHPQERIKIFASGSSAIEMHKHLKESMAGRFNKYYIRPLSYEEYISDQTKKNKLEDYVRFGGLPGVYDKEYAKDPMKKEIYLKNIYTTYIQKDVKSLVLEDNISAFNNLCFILAENQGQILPSTNLANEVRISASTVEKYLDILQETFILHQVKSFAKNLSNELKKSKKYYFYDLGIRNAIANNFQFTEKEKGKIWEGYVYNYLVTLTDQTNAEVYFWRTSDQVEIDFIWLRNRIPTPIEVKSTLSKAEAPKAFKTFIRAYPNAPMGIVINKTINETIWFMEKPVHFISFENISELKTLLHSTSEC